MQSTTPLRLRLSLWSRTLVALCVVLTFTLAVTAVVSVFGAIMMAFLIGYLFRAVEVFAAAPRLSAILPASPEAVAVVSIAGVCVLPAVVLGVSLSTKQEFSDQETMQHVASTHQSLSTKQGFSDQYPRMAVIVFVGWLGCLYLAATETSFIVLSSTGMTLLGVAVVFGFGALVAVWATVTGARHELGQLREQLVDESEPAAEQRAELVETVDRLAIQADIPAPALRITDAERPESFALGTGGNAVIVVSTGLLETLSADETTAVLAHEVSHLANADSRIMGLVLVPVLMADELLDENTDDVMGHLLNAGIWCLKLYGQLGVAVLSRGREWHADAGAVALTGSPAALAAALTKLSEQRETPTTDLRQWEQSAGALDILPPADRHQATGPFRTHPSTDARIERLRQQVVDAEQ